MSDVTRPEAEVEIILVLPNGAALPKVECDEFWREVEDALPWLPPGIPCRIDHLVTPKFWLSRRHRRRRTLGRFLAYWVATGQLPLEFVGDKCRTNKRYRRKT